MNDSLLTLVLLDDFLTPNMFDLAKALRARHPGLAVEDPKESGEAGDRKDAASSPLIRCGGEDVVVMSMPAPMPDDPGLWARTYAAWPEGKTITARHRGHLIVFVVGERLPPLARARLTTAVVGALVATVPGCCGVVWGLKVARPAKLWLEMSTRAFAPYPDYPVELWVDVLPFRPNAGIGAVTMGLAPFAEREIEFETTKLPLSVMMDRVGGLAIYLIEHGKLVKDGDTVGADEQERFRVRYKTSDQFGGLPVFYCAAD